MKVFIFIILFFTASCSNNSDTVNYNNVINPNVDSDMSLLMRDMALSLDGLKMQIENSKLDSNVKLDFAEIHNKGVTDSSFIVENFQIMSENFSLLVDALESDINIENYNNLIKNYAIMNEICQNNNILFKTIHPSFTIMDVYHLYKHRLVTQETQTRLLFKTILNTEKLPIKLLEGTEKALYQMPTTFIALFDRLDNVVNYIDIRDYASEFFKNQTRECIEENIKYPFARDNDHPSELFHQFLAYISRNVLLKEGVKL